MSRRVLTDDEAVKLLPEGESIHTFYNLPTMLLGADWSRAEVLHKLREEGVLIELTGGKARETGHGMCVHPNKETYPTGNYYGMNATPEEAAAAWNRRADTSC